MRGERARERERERLGLSPGSQKKGGREEADSGSDGGQEQIQEEGKWMGCLVYRLFSVSHSGNDLVVNVHCVKRVLQHEPEDTKHEKCIREIV